MLSAHGTVTIRPKEVIPIYREEWDARVTDYKYDLVNRDFVSRGGNIYQVKVQRPNEFVPAGIDPDSEVGEQYWEIFNKLSPSVTNFLVIVDEDGNPQTLLSGGRIQTKFLNIGSLNMGETRLWGGAEPMKGKGLALVNDPGDRKFVVYNDSTHYVEMFQRENEWGLNGVVNGSPVFQLGSTNKIGGFDITDDRIGSIFGTGGVGNGMSLYNFVVKFKSDNSEDSRFAALGTSVYPSSTAQSTLLRLEETRSGNLDNILSYFYCSGASGVLDSRNIAIKVGNGDVDIDNGNLNMAAGNFMKMKGQIHFDNVVTYTGSGAVTITADSGHFIHLTPITGNPVVSVSSGLPIGSWFIIAHTTTAGAHYYIKLSGSDCFRRRGNAYQQVNSNNQDPSLIFKVSNTTWVIGHLPVNWIDWN